MSSKPFLAQASAPGKVLILGGYLIVVSPNVGISIGVNARFTTRVIEAVQLSPLATATVETIVHVASPQFHQNYTFHVHGTAASTPADEVLTIEQIEGPPSGFLKYAILYAVAASRVKDKNVNYEIHMELLADNDFYSQRNYLESAGQEVNVVNLRGLPKHLPLVGSVSKTGLGSSAAMTTSVVAGLYTFFQQNVPETIELVHRIAQIAHSVAQGKIGSGFDVFTAVFGTCAYRRFPASKVEMMVEAAEDGEVQSVPVTQLAKCIALTEEWVANVPFQLPAGIHLVLGDVHKGGSGTPGMVSKIMAWREAVMEKEDNLWRRLQSSNEDYLSQLRDLLSQAHNNPTSHMHAVEALSQTPNLAEYEPTDDMERTFVNAARAAAQCRGQLRSMGVAAGVKIEPEELTDMLDATAALPGVFAVGCPGAGGYDAIFALVVGTAETRARVEKFWESYESLHVCPLLVEEDPKGLVMEL